MHEWPVSEERLRRLLSSDESPNIEFKESAYDFGEKKAKGEFIKDVLALANCTAPETPSYLILGVKDHQRGGHVVGLPSRVDADQISQILAAHTEPVPDVRTTNITLNDKILGVVCIRWTSAHPYYATRSIGDSLSANAVYIRRGATVGRLAPAEFEVFIRAKSARLGAIVNQEPLRCGFVDGGHWSGPYGPVLRIVNVGDAMVNNVQLVFDVAAKADVTIFERIMVLSDATLQPEESRECELNLRELRLENSHGKKQDTAAQRVRWLDVTARVRYRDRFGFLRELHSATYLPVDY